MKWTIVAVQHEKTKPQYSWYEKNKSRMNFEDLHFYKQSWKKDSWIMNHGWWGGITSGVLCNQWWWSIM
jgi:hypothetical protein